MDRLRPLLLLCACLAPRSLPAAQCELQTLVVPAGRPPGFGWRIAQDGQRFAIATDGSVRVYVQEGLTAFLEQELAFSGYSPGAFRVQDLALSGDTLAVAAFGAERVFLFEHRAGSWDQVEELVPRPGELLFGQSLALEGARLAIVALEATPPDFPYPSVVLVYERAGPRWQRVARLASPLGAGEAFGSAIDLDGGRLAVAVAGRASSPEPGRAYVFEPAAAGWQRHDLVSARLAPAGFGAELDLRGDRLVIAGASATPGALARVFDFDGATWRETAELVTAGTVAGSAHVDVVLAEHGLVLAGTPWSDERARDGGAVCVFEEVAGAWAQRAQLFSSSPAAGEGFGAAVSCAGDLALLGSQNGGLARTFSPRESACRTLNAVPAEVSLSAGGRQTLRLNPGRDLAGRTFLLLGSASGSDPGFRLPGARVPLVPDWYFQSSLPRSRSAPFVDNIGTLRAPSPQAEVTIDVPAGTSAALAGLTLHHAFLVLEGGRVVHASNVRTLKLVP